MLVKYKNRSEIEASPTQITVDEKQYINPNEDILTQAGYRPLLTEPLPEYDSETQYLLSYYTDEGMNIVKHWSVEELPKPELNEYDKRLEDVERGLLDTQLALVEIYEGGN